MHIEIPFRYAVGSSLGKIFLPIIPVSLKTVDGWKEFEFIMDTGADLTILPNSAFILLGINKRDCKRSKTEGIGGKIITTWETKILLKITNLKLDVQCAITQDDKTPFLLGRVDFLDKIDSLCFDSKKRLILINT